mgnify:CR=1 FL=1
MPDIPVEGFANAFNAFFQMGPIAWGLAVIIGGSVGAFITRLLISAFWR